MFRFIGLISLLVVSFVLGVFAEYNCSVSEKFCKCCTVCGFDYPESVLTKNSSSDANSCVCVCIDCTKCPCCNKCPFLKDKKVCPCLCPCCNDCKCCPACPGKCGKGKCNCDKCDCCPKCPGKNKPKKTSSIRHTTDIFNGLCHTRAIWLD